MSEALRLYLPRDAAALSVGADELAVALETAATTAGLTLDLVRTGSRGALWLEPLLEVERDGERCGYGPLTAADAAAVLDAIRTGGDHPAAIGPVEALPWFRAQTRLLFKRCGLIDPLDLEGWKALGGLDGLRKAAALKPEEIVDQVTQSGLRGRGGAGFPAGIKWKTAAEAPGPEKYICCNADEGDSGTFADRMLMEGDPFTLIEGMIIAGMAVGAQTGLVYLRSEYPHAIATMKEAVLLCEAAGILGEDILGSGRAFRIEIRRGAGSYVCGEESAMLDSLEGKRGQVRVKPPLPALEGLFGKPTIVNNVLTLASAPSVLAEGPEAYAALGEGRSRGTQAFQLAGNIARGGLFEAPFGIELKTLIEEIGGGTRSGRPLKAVQAGGPLGAYIPARRFDIALDYETLAEAGFMLGHGGLVVFDDTADMARLAEFAFEFCAEESCGKCTPCRIGAVRGTETVAKIRKGEEVEANLELVGDLCELMRDGSLCAMGGLTPMPVESALQYFPEEFGIRTREMEEG